VSLDTEAERIQCQDFLDEVERDEYELEDAMSELISRGNAGMWRQDMVASIREKVAAYFAELDTAKAERAWESMMNDGETPRGRQAEYDLLHLQAEARRLK